MAMRISRHLRPMFADEDEFLKANLPLKCLFERFPDSRLWLRTSKTTVIVDKTDMEEFTPEPIVEPEEPSHAGRAMQYFIEKEAQANKILEEVNKELEKRNRQDLIKQLWSATQFKFSGDWLERSDDKCDSGTL